MTREYALKQLDEMASYYAVERSTLRAENNFIGDPPDWTWREQHELSRKLRKIATALKGAK